jgi:hypothetical protein
VAVLHAEQEKGVAASPAEEKQKTDEVERKADELIRQTSRETAARATGSTGP